MCNEVFKGIQIVSASNRPESQYCARGFVECWQRGRCLLLTLLTPECSVRPSLWLLLPRWEHVVWSQHGVICLQNNIMFTAPASHESCLYHRFQEFWRCSDIMNEEYFVKDSSGGTELEQDFLNCGRVAKRILCISGTVEMLRWSQVQGGGNQGEQCALFNSKLVTPILFFLSIAGVLCIRICCTIQHGIAMPLKKYMVKRVLERTLSQASKKQNETHYFEKGNYSETTYENCRWTQYVVEWLTRKHSRWPPNSAWTIWYSKTWATVLINVAVL